MEVEKLLKGYLKIGKMMQVATLSGDQPWNCTVFFVPDEEMNLYWISLPHTRHSQEIRAHNKIAATIPIKYKPGEDVVGVQLEGDASEINNPEEIKTAIRLYADRYETGDKWYQDFLAGKNPHKLYRIQPKLFVIFDEENFPENSRQEWHLK